LIPGIAFIRLWKTQKLLAVAKGWEVLIEQCSSGAAERCV